MRVCVVCRQTTVTKSMLCVIPKNAKPGDVIELVSLEGRRHH